ncbi:MAG: hypothetical protein U9N57_01280 [Pseudomonadota bacterium]|nr:hypothetical protein [Pseudomonadota bacterium]
MAGGGGILAYRMGSSIGMCSDDNSGMRKLSYVPQCPTGYIYAGALQGNTYNGFDESTELMRHDGSDTSSCSMVARICSKIQ